MKRYLDCLDLEAERESKAINTIRHNAPKTQKPYYGRNDYKKMSIGYRRAIADADIIFTYLVRQDAKKNPITL